MGEFENKKTTKDIFKDSLLAVSVVAVTTLGGCSPVSNAQNFESKPKTPVVTLTPPKEGDFGSREISSNPVAFKSYPTKISNPVPTLANTHVPTEIILSSFPEPTPTVGEEKKRMITYGDVKLYRDADDTEPFSHLIAGKSFEVKEEEQNGRIRIEVTEENGVTWEAWTNTTGNFYGQGETPPTPVPRETAKSFSKEIILADGKFVIENEGSLYYLDVAHSGFREDGSIAHGDEAYTFHSDYINQMFEQYNTGGKKLKIIYTEYEGSPNDERFYRTSWSVDMEDENTIIFNFSLSNQYVYGHSYEDSVVYYVVNTEGVASFLLGHYDGTPVRNEELTGREDLMNLYTPSRIRIYQN